MTGGPYPSRVTRDILLVLISGGLALGGIVIGHLLTARTSRAAEIDRREAEDARRWRSDRRAIYAKYLGLASVMLRDIDGIGCLPYDGSQSLSAEDDEAIRELLFEYIVDWNEDLQPALGEVQLLASPEVADESSLTTIRRGFKPKIFWRFFARRCDRSLACPASLSRMGVSLIGHGFQIDLPEVHTYRRIRVAAIGRRRSLRLETRPSPATMSIPAPISS
jgi:hypothetical protein